MTEQVRTQEELVELHIDDLITISNVRTGPLPAIPVLKEQLTAVGQITPVICCRVDENIAHLEGRIPVFEEKLAHQ